MYLKHQLKTLYSNAGANILNFVQGVTVQKYSGMRTLADIKGITTGSGGCSLGHGYWS